MVALALQLKPEALSERLRTELACSRASVCEKPSGRPVEGVVVKEEKAKSEVDEKPSEEEAASGLGKLFE
jgi:hypothetical protein